MITKRRLFGFGLVLALSLTVSAIGPRAAPDTLPSRLSDDEFWKLSTDLSEPGGSFRSDNLLSNELGLQHVIPDLLKKAKSGRAYLGVGPEQNFTYIAALKPRMVFIVDVRRGNLQLHLLYKALFEVSSDRATFVSRLFSRKRPDGIGTRSSIAEIMGAYEEVEGSEALFKENLKAVQDYLTVTRHIPLSTDDLQGIEYVYQAFFWYGPEIEYWSSGGRWGGRFRATYADLMMADDGKSQPRGYLANEENFGIMKTLEEKNLLIPVVGNFAGTRALRSVGKYLKDHGAVVSAFYLSNVEQYLNQDGIWSSFCSNVAALPLDETSTFIRSTRTGYYGRGMGLTQMLGEIQTETKACGTVSRQSQVDGRSRSR